MLHITDKAAEKMREFIENDKDSTENTSVRVQIMPGGCSGFKYDLTITEEKHSDDIPMKLMNGVTILIDPFSSQYIEGTTIDYEKTMMTEGFTFKNPLAKATCGCNQSFTV